MQTLKIEVQDSFIDKFFDFVNQYKDDIKILKDKNLKLDPYFYERKKELHKIKDDIKDGIMPTYDLEKSINELIKELES